MHILCISTSNLMNILVDVEGEDEYIVYFNFKPYERFGGRGRGRCIYCVFQLQTL